MRRLGFRSVILAGVIGLSPSTTMGLAQQEKLKVGDPAPPLAVSTWLHGGEVKGFESGHIYVVEFWATWCGPCVQIMPHMGDLQDEYRAKGITFIGFASEANDKEANVNAFVAKHGAKLGYTFAFGAGTETHAAYMKASGQQGIPCSFVVDQKGKIAYIGHPFFLDYVLPKVLDGTWDPKAAAGILAAADKDFDAAYAVMGSDTDTAQAGLDALANFADKWPGFTDNVYMNPVKLGLVVRVKRLAEAKELAEKLLVKAVARGDTSGLLGVSSALCNESTRGHADLAALAIKAAEASYEIDPEHRGGLVKLLEAYAFAGEQAKVKELGPKAVAAAKAEVRGADDAIGTLGIAAAYFASGDKEQAKAIAEKAINMVAPTAIGMRRYVEERAKKYRARAQSPQAKSDR
jgi:thiol-disulfide isomerase/thioredoxin